MNGMVNSYYTLNRILLLSIGLWPYQKTSFRYITIAVTSIIILSGIIVQFMTFITTKYNMDLLLQILAYNLPFIGFLLKYSILCTNMKNIRDLMDRVHCDWNELNNTHEIEIIKKYSAIGRFIAFASTLFMYICMTGFVLMQISLNFVNTGAALNESRPRKLPALAEYFIDQQKYFYPLLLHMILFVFSGITTLVATETLHMSYAQHACGLFQIASYRIEQTLRKNMIRDVVLADERNLAVYQGIISAVDIHRKAIEFIEMLKEDFVMAYFWALPLGVISLSVNLYRLSRLIMSEYDHELIVTIIYIIGHFWYIFFCNYLGQEVIDHSGHIFCKIYSSFWYVAPLKAQKLLLLVMQRSMRHSTIFIGGLFVLSLEGFASLLSVSLSYFMVIYSVN